MVKEQLAKHSPPSPDKESKHIVQHPVGHVDDEALDGSEDDESGVGSLQLPDDIVIKKEPVATVSSSGAKQAVLSINSPNPNAFD